MPEISIVAGAYNISHYFALKKSMESILNQTFSDFEFIICDDGSTDNTWSILQSYAEKDKRIKLLRNERNLGLAATLNRCINTSVCKYIARHDLDDYCDIERLKKQVDFLERHPDVAILGTRAFLFDENGVWGKEDFPLSVSNKDFLFNSPYKHGSVMFRREALMNAGCYRVSKETRRAEDYDLFMTMQSFCKGGNLDEYLYFFCENSAAKKRRKYRYRIDEAKVRAKGFKKLGLLPKGYIYIVKPLVVGLIPSGMLDRLKNKYYKHRKLW